jgi:hypothetical protein
MAELRQIEWNDPEPEEVQPFDYVCGHCGKHVGPNRGFCGRDDHAGTHAIYLCSFCTKPTYFDENDNQMPVQSCGEYVANLPPDIATLYEECRSAVSVEASTCATMGLRTLLAHIAVERGAPENQTFVQYVNYLVEKHLVPPGADEWLDHIRTYANDAVHKLHIIGFEDGDELLEFTGMVLRLVYEYPARGASRAAKRTAITKKGG